MKIYNLEPILDLKEFTRISFSGEWKENEKHKGTLFYRDGEKGVNKYEGTFFKDLLHGKGVITFADGDVYNGEFLNG